MEVKNKVNEMHDCETNELSPALPQQSQVKDFGTHEAFRYSMFVSNYYRDANWVSEHKNLTNQLLGFHKASAMRKSALFDTYIGAYGGRKPRFDLHYILNIDLEVLYHFLPHLRRADYLNEHGKPTRVVTTPEAIYFPVRREENPVEQINLSDFTSSDVHLTKGTIYPELEVVDVAGAQKDLTSYMVGPKAPKYLDLSKLYYGDAPSPMSTEQLLGFVENI